MVLVCNAYFMDMVVQIPGRIAATARIAIVEDTAVIVLELGVRVR